MVMAGRCQGRRDDAPCRAAPVRGELYCFFHSPEHAEALKDAQRLGGQRRKREATVAVAFDVEGLESVQELRRLLYVAAFDALSLENSVARNRLLVAIVLAGSKLLE